MDKINEHIPMEQKEATINALKACKNSIDSIDDNCEAAFILTNCFFHEHSETLFP